MSNALSPTGLSVPFSRFSLFVVYFWFGILKIVGQSPADELALNLLDKTMPFMDPASFLISLGVFEVFIGILFLVPRFEKPALFLLFFHIIMVVLPLFILPQIAWSGILVPTLEGQYIIKNILIISIALNLLAKRRT